jgi:hypothetical protein
MAEVEPSEESATAQPIPKPVLNNISLAVGVIGAIASLISIPLAIYFYGAARQQPELTYYLHPVKATIVRTGEASRLTTSFDGKPIPTDITAAQIAIWNEGSKAIRKEQILKPIVIYTQNGAPILEATLRRSSREVINLSLVTDGFQQGRVGVQWNILEHNDGGIIQLIYAGDPTVQIAADGIVEGQQSIKRLEFAGTIKSPNEQYESTRGDYKGPGYLMLGLSFFLALAAFGVRKARTDNRGAVRSLLDAYDSGISSLSQGIEWETEQLSYYIKAEEDAKKDQEQCKELYANHPKQLEELIDNSEALIKRHARQFIESKDRIKERQADKEAYIKRKNHAVKAHQTQERVFFALILVTFLGSLLLLIPTVYLLFVAKPPGPPFQF